MHELLSLYRDTLLPIALVTALGYYSGRRAIIQAPQLHGLSTFLMQFALPCSLFLGIARTSFAALCHDWPLPVTSAVAMLAVYGLVFAGRHTVGVRRTDEASVLALTASFANNAAIGLPLLTGLFGGAGIVPVASAIVVGSLVVTPVTLVILEYVQQRSADATILASFRSRLRAAVWVSCRRPIVWAPVLAFVWSALRWPVPAAVTGTLEILGRSAVALALFVTGVVLSTAAFRISRAVLLGVLLKNVLQPALVLVLLLPLHISHELRRDAFLLAAIPAGFFGTVFGNRYGVTSPDASSTLVCSMALGCLTLPIAVLLLGRL